MAGIATKATAVAVDRSAEAGEEVGAGLETTGLPRHKGAMTQAGGLADCRPTAAVRLPQTTMAPPDVNDVRRLLLGRAAKEADNISVPSTPP